MSGLRKAIASRKAAAATSSSPPPPPTAPAPAPAAPPSAPAPAPAPSSSIRRGFLASAPPLYPDGSAEASAPARAPRFELRALDEGYEVLGRFEEAGRFLGKEDFDVTRAGRRLRIKGNPQNDPQSLVSTLDETIDLPLDADWEGMQAEFVHCCLRISIRRVPQLGALLAELQARLPQLDFTRLLERLENSSSAEEAAQLLIEAGVQPPAGHAAAADA
ncbi:hypothetical protein AB1Y20_016579 [Prymnesium parvum]|uniref:Uncharacterized protein n=1 Tax=Prymnesium parvum TaxID=97485 RepID=A0AB34IAH3_PRYPA